MYYAAGDPTSLPLTSPGRHHQWDEIIIEDHLHLPFSTSSMQEDVSAALDNQCAPSSSTSSSESGDS